MDATDEIIPFSNDKFGGLRAILIEDEPWFIAVDVCNGLQIRNATDAIKRLDEDEKARLNLRLQGGPTNIVSFPGLLALILGSRKKEAREYKRWVTHEVLPSIHKHGGYLTPDKVEEALLDPDTVIRLATSLKEERARRQALESRNALIAPKAGFYDAVMDDSRWFSVTEAARQMHQYDSRMNRSRLFALLRADRMMTADNQATKLAIDRGYLMNYQPPQQRNAKTGEVMVPKPYGKVTGKGLDWCIRRYCSEVR